MVDDHSYSAIIMGASFSGIVFYIFRILFEEYTTQKGELEMERKTPT